MPMGYKAIPMPPEEAKSNIDRPGTTANKVANIVWLIFFGWAIVIMLAIGFFISIINGIGKHPLRLVY